MSDEPVVPLLAVGLRLVAEGPWSERLNGPLEAGVVLACEQYGLAPQPWSWDPQMPALSARQASLLLIMAGGPADAPVRAPARARGVPDLLLGVRLVRESLWPGRANHHLADSIAARAEHYGISGGEWFWWPALTARSHAGASRFLALLGADEAVDAALQFDHGRTGGVSVPGMSAAPDAAWPRWPRTVAHLPGEGHGLEDFT